MKFVSCTVLYIQVWYYAQSYTRKVSIIHPLHYLPFFLIQASILIFSGYIIRYFTKSLEFETVTNLFSVLIIYFQLFMGSSFMSFNWLLLIMIFLMKNVQKFFPLSLMMPRSCMMYQCITLHSGSFVFLGSFDGLELTVLPYKRQGCVQQTSQQYCNRWFQVIYVHYCLHV